MEHRFSKRYLVEIEVFIDPGSAGKFKGRTKNISYDGMYVYTSVSHLFPYMGVNVHFCLGNIEHFADALVVHASNHGAGILFCDPLPVDVWPPNLTQFRTIAFTTSV